MSRQWFLLFILCVALNMPCLAMEIHVSPNGAAAGDGTAEAPFATLAQARDALDNVDREAGITVIVHGGMYELNAPLILGASESGTADAPVVIRAAEGEEVRLSGGRTLPGDAFHAVQNAGVLARIDEGAKANVLVCDLAAMGIHALGEMPDQFQTPPAVPELFFDGARMTLARWPNEGFAEIAEVVESGPAPWRNHASEALPVFKYGDDRPARWMQAPGVWLQGYWCFDWAIDTIKVGSIEAGSKQITLSKQHHYGLGSGNPAPRRYVAFNLLEELDQAGEYYLDRENGQLYVWPPGNVADAHVVLSLLTEPVLQLTNAQHVSLEGFTVETTAGSGIQIEGGSSVRIAGCTVRNTGHDGIVVEGGEAHTVRSCDIHDTGMHGISIHGGDRKTLRPSRHELVNNHIHHVSRRQRTATYHITMNGVGIRVAHNRLHDAPHQSVLFSGNDHIFEYNELYNIGMDSDDCGALYMGRNPSERGSVIRYNYFHDVGSEFAHGSCAVYFDDGTGGQVVHGNVFVRAAGGNFGAVFIHGGHDNAVTNNVFVDCQRAMGHAPWAPAGWQEWLDGELWQQRLLQEVDITQPPYTEKYPALIGFFETAQTPRLNIGDCNVVVNGQEVAGGDWLLKDTLILKSDAGFVDTANGNYALKPDSVVYKRMPDFRPIPFEAIGTYSDAWRE
jgi:hypothetical protein